MVQQISRLVEESDQIDAQTAVEILECQRLQVDEAQILQMMEKISEDDLDELHTVSKLL